MEQKDKGKCSMYDGQTLTRGALQGAYDKGDRNFRRINLPGVYLCGANLSGTDFLRANLCGADLSGVHLPFASLFDANLSDANLLGANLSNADLRGANLRGAFLFSANLLNADLRRAHFSGSNLAMTLCQCSKVNAMIMSMRRKQTYIFLVETFLILGDLIPVDDLNFRVLELITPGNLLPALLAAFKTVGEQRAVRAGGQFDQKLSNS